MTLPIGQLFVALLAETKRALAIRCHRFSRRLGRLSASLASVLGPNRRKVHPAPRVTTVRRRNCTIIMRWCSDRDLAANLHHSVTREIEDISNMRGVPVHGREQDNQPARGPFAILP